MRGGIAARKWTTSRGAGLDGRPWIGRAMRARMSNSGAGTCGRPRRKYAARDWTDDRIAPAAPHGM